MNQTSRDGGPDVGRRSRAAWLLTVGAGVLVALASAGCSGKKRRASDETPLVAPDPAPMDPAPGRRTRPATPPPHVGVPTRLAPRGGQPLDRFGQAAVDGDVMVVGADGDDEAGDAAGAAYVFERREAGGWTQTQKLTAADGAGFDSFGTGVGISGGTIVIGAPGKDGDKDASGAAYVFERRKGGSWEQVAVLTAAREMDRANFGNSVTVARGGRFVAVGAPRRDEGGTVSGAVHLFERTKARGYRQTQTLLASPSIPFGHFGVAVALDGDDLVVGARGRATQPGKAYVFRRVKDAWKQHAILAPPGGHPGDFFGESVAARSGTIAIGATAHRREGMPAGRAYVFGRSGSGFVERATLSTGLRNGTPLCGHAVAVSGSRVAVACPGDDRGSVSVGSVHVFEKGSGGAWRRAGVVLSSNAGAGHGFGGSVVLTETLLIVGANNEGESPDQSNGTGAVHVFPIKKP